MAYTLISTLPDYLGVSETERISRSPVWFTKSPGQKRVWIYFFLKKDKKSSEFYLQIKKSIAFFVKDGCIVVKLYSTLVYVHPF